MKHHITLSCLLLAGIPLPQVAFAQDAPAFEVGDPLVLTSEDFLTSEAGIAINQDEPEVLFTTIVSDASGFGNLDMTDPITGQLSQTAMVGYFFDPISMTPKGDPFVILGNPMGNMQRHDVKYNRFTKQYNVVVNARSRSSNGNHIPLVAIVNPASSPGDRIVKAMAIDEDTMINYDDTSIASSNKNGHFLVAAEYQYPGEGEGVVGYLFDAQGDLLTPEFGRLDLMEPARDEDDPDVVYLEENDVFLFLTNTDPTSGANIITGSIVATTVGTNGQLQIGDQQILGERRINLNQGHPSAIENPFNNELIGGFDYNNGSDGGDLFYFNIGPAPTYTLTEARPQVPYMEATGNDPYNHRHPQFAVDPNSGVIVLMTNPHGSASDLPNGIGFTFLGQEGEILPGVRTEDGFSHVLVPTFDPLIEGGNPSISNDANYYNVKYDPFSDSFIAIWADQSLFTFAVQLKMLNNDVDSGPSSIAIESARNGTATLSWESGVLQSTANLESPDWQDVNGATSPHELNTSESKAFYRLRN